MGDDPPEPRHRRNKQTVTSFFGHLSTGDVKHAFGVVADHAIWWVPGDLPICGTRTKDQYQAALAAIGTEFPSGLTYTMHGLTAEADRVAAEVISTGTHLNGKPYTNHHHFLFTVRDGQIVAASG